ncbi:MAG: hypothetical protein NVV72_17485 [Asticcacaulis sp.]|nr:hypothetical protein [Asticcacaulis sp.]
MTESSSIFRSVSESKAGVDDVFAGLGAGSGVLTGAGFGAGFGLDFGLVAAFTLGATGFLAAEIVLALAFAAGFSGEGAEAAVLRGVLVIGGVPNQSSGYRLAVRQGSRQDN